MNRVFKYALIFAFIGIAIFALSQMSDNVSADEHIWDGGSTTDNLASNATNWQSDSIPIAGDGIIIEGVGIGDMDYDINVVPSYFIMGANYNGIVTLTGSSWNNNGAIDVYKGTLVIEDAYTMWCIVQYNTNSMVYINNTLTTNGANIFYNVEINSKLTQVVSSKVNTQVNINADFTGRLYYNGTIDISTNQQYWTGWLYTQNDIAIEYNAYAYLAFQHDAWLGVQLESWSGTDNFTWNSTSVASQTVQWSWSRGESSAMYDEYQDGIYIGSDETNAGGMGTFTSTFVGNHAFLLSRSSFLPASTDISDDVWLGIVFMSIATLITLFGYVRRIGLVMIISFLLLVIGTLASTQIWVELWTLPTLFILVNAVLMTHGLLRKV